MFYNRKKEMKNIADIINDDPVSIHFIYGPINSGKTNLICHVMQNMPETVIPFYINLRGRNIVSSEDFLDSLFSIDRKTKFKSIIDYLKELIPDSVDIIRAGTGIPVPARLFELIFGSSAKGEDAFAYLESFFSALVMKKYKPVLILDELQMIKEIVNSKGSPLLNNLFQFFIRMTKETHLCHCMAVSSDSLFIQRIHAHARLKGRSQYVLIDNVEKTEAFKIYEDFGFSDDKDLIWSYIGGKLGDMAILKSLLNQGYNTEESLKKMLADEVNSLFLIERQLMEEEKTKCEKKLNFLFEVAYKETVAFKNKNWNEIEFWSRENVLFMDPVLRIIKPHGELCRRAILTFEKEIE